MIAPILLTKFYIPPTRVQLVQRQKLIERLNDGIEKRLTLISAPAGFGKTTLVSDWVEGLQDIDQTMGRPVKIGWLSLDQNDNDFVRFLTYFITALNQIKDMDLEIGQGVLNMLQSSQPPPTNAVLISLINEFVKITDKIVFILDDYHLIETDSIHQAMAFLLENIPPQLHLVIVTRQDPPLSLGRLRARAQMTELRAADLRFSASETTDFLNRVMGLNISSKEILQLENRTEGWIAGLQLAAISLQGVDDTRTFIESFTGGHRLILDFLIEEVLERQTDKIQEFLLCTSILNRLSGPLCDALTGYEDGQDTLEMLDHANLFIVSLDDSRRWYRYHHLFADLLKQRLSVQRKGEIDELHLQAADWYKKNDDLSEAVHHAFAGGDFELVSRVVEKGALAALKKSDFRFILDSIAQLPESIVNNSLWLLINHTWALLLTGHVEAAGPNLEKIDGLLDLISGFDEMQRREIFGNIAGLKMINDSWNRRHEKLPEYSKQVRKYLPEENWIRGLCAIMMGGFYWGNGNLEDAIDAFEESVYAGKASGNKMIAVSGACNQADSLELAGHLHQAVDLLQDTFEQAKLKGKLLPVAGYIFIGLARIYYELNQLDDANYHLQEALKLGQQMADQRAEKIIFGLLTKVQTAAWDFEKANESVINAQNAVPGFEVDYDLRGSDYPQVWLWLKTKKIGELERWIEENPFDIEDVSHFKTKFTLSIHARVLIAIYRVSKDDNAIHTALECLEGLLELAEKYGWGSKVIEILALQAVAFQELGDSDQAQTKLEKALLLAEPEGFIRTFVDEGPPMASLLYTALKREIAPAYVQRLLAAFPDNPRNDDVPAGSQDDQSDLIEPLSDREIEVLQWLAKGLTNQDVANQLVLSIHTVKAHTRSIYSKLAVHNRTQAVDRARTLGVLPST